MHCMATGHGNGAPKAFLGGIPSALKPTPDPEVPKADLSVRFQDPLTTTDPAALMCLPTDSTDIPSVLMAKKPPSYQLGRMTRSPGAFMAFMTSSGHSHSPYSRDHRNPKGDIQTAKQMVKLVQKTLMSKRKLVRIQRDWCGFRGRD